MALLALEAQRKNLVQSMHDEGMLNHQFTQLRDLQDENTPNFVAEIISLFCRNTKEVITELKKYLCEEVVDFEKLSTFVHQLKGSSSSIGAKQITLACGDLHQASDHKNKHGFLKALNSISEKYFQLEHRFQALMQLEKRILDIEANPQLQEQLPDGNYAAV